MGGIADLFEPEELFGEYWHRLVDDVGREASFPHAGVDYKDVSKRLDIYFRGLGGASGVAIKPIDSQNSAYRQNFLTRIVHGSNAVTRAKFDGDFLYLPERLEVLPEKTLNEDLYKWLVAWNAVVGDQLPILSNDPLQNDIEYLRFANGITQHVLKEFRGLNSTYVRLVSALLEIRPVRKLPPQERAIEDVINAVLKASDQPSSEGLIGEILNAVLDPKLEIGHLLADRKYMTFLPMVLWGDVQATLLETPNKRQTGEETTPSGDENEDEDEKTRKAKRQKSDQIENKDSLILHRFESILSWTEMMNIPRAIDDDDEENAKRAADEQEELGITNVARKAATKLKFDLDLAPEDVEIERLSDICTYPEWDYRRNIYHVDHCRVLAHVAQTLEGTDWQPDKKARRRIRAVKRQFEALRPRRENIYGQIDGNEIDFNSLIRSRCDYLATGEGSDRVFINTKDEARDLSVAILVDVSRSSESWIEGQQVINISKEALLALSMGLTACGDANAIYSFSSLKRDRVHIATIKQFDEPLGTPVFSRIGALKPGFYTRLGAAIRHVSKELAATASSKKLLLVLSDGKPNDLDHYEGRYGVEDSAMAVREARRNGTAVFGITIDKKAQSYFPHIFGRNAFSITNHANDLVSALPRIYRHLVT